MNEGWRCPCCGTCYAPWVRKCDNCCSITVTYPIYPTIPYPATPGWPDDPNKDLGPVITWEWRKATSSISQQWY